MFKFLKNKINNWIGKIKKEKISEDAEKKVEKEKTEKKTKQKRKKEKKEAKKQEEVEEIKEKEEEIEKKPEKKAKEEKKKEKQIKKIDKREQKAKEKEEKLEAKKQEEVEEIKEKEEEIEKKPEKKSIFKKIKKLATTKISESEFEKQFEDFETGLAENNVALETIDEIKNKMKEAIVDKEIKKQDLEGEIKNSLKEAISSLLLEPIDIVKKVKEKKEKRPFVIVFFGINGSGKTTTIAKLVNLFSQNNLSCVIAASDTFRAASIEQLEIHAKNLNVKLIKHDYGTDPAAVAFDAIKYAQAKNIKVVLVDTAGRMHTSQNLMREMEKICRVTKPDIRLFIAESITGNDAINQAKNFSESVGIDGIILTKADVDEKGGTAISIGYVTGKPILFLGTGQRYSDLQEFNKNKLLESFGL